MAKGYRALIARTYRPLAARRYEARLNREPSQLALVGIPTGIVMLGSMATLLPIIANMPILPPFGFLFLIAWRMIVRDLWPVWAALPLGLFDDMFSGQPIGSAMLIWTLAFFVIDLFDRGMMWRDYRQDWGIASGLIVAALGLALWIANATGGDTGITVILPQIILSVLVYPLVVRACAALDRLRWLL
jgi:rod shape-determining protein MreD